MKTKILFVTDEASLLQELQWLLRPMRQEWEMTFAESAAKALDIMATESFDVAISDMHMSGMNGVDFLNEVMKQQPKAVRFLLASHSDLELIYESVGLVNEFLLKPCDERTLKTAVLGALKRETSSRSEALGKVLAKIHRLPSLPTLYLELVQLIENPVAGLDEIGSVIARDIAMTAIVLRLVNSAYFGLRHRVSNVTDAAKYLGVETLRSLVLSIKAFSQYGALQIDGFSAESLWAHSLETAVAAKTIAKLEGAGQKMSEEAFVAGMLHDIGKLVLSANMQDSYREVVQMVSKENISFFEAEQAIFGANHADVGGQILSYWGLPLPIVNAVSSHHQPARPGQNIFGPLTVVHVSNALLHQRHRQKARLETEPDRELDLNYLEELGLVDRLPVWRDALNSETAVDLGMSVKLPWQKVTPARPGLHRSSPLR